ncbi:hypothetical protein pipiens_016326 [Culex pipiens pipiens]|uniref:Uncharacterized protein n=1 Tax=Culex pipiens pipiens TaxID=38569 RepID=A0ABD1CLS8_CULPP
MSNRVDSTNLSSERSLHLTSAIDAIRIRYVVQVPTSESESSIAAFSILLQLLLDLPGRRFLFTGEI